MEMSIERDEVLFCEPFSCLYNPVFHRRCGQMFRTRVSLRTTLGLVVWERLVLIDVYLGPRPEHTGLVPIRIVTV